MGSFPALPSGNNPAIGAAAGAAGAAASIYNNLQSRLQQAANQHAAQAQQQQNAARAQAVQDAQFGAAAIARGDIPAQTTTITPVGTPGSSGVPGKTLQRRTTTDNPDVPQQAKGQFYADASGKQYYHKTPEEKLDETNSFTLDAEGARHAQDAGLSNIKANTAYPNTLMPALNQRIRDYHTQTDEGGFDAMPQNFGSFQYNGQQLPVVKGRKSGRPYVMSPSGGLPQSFEDYIASQGAQPAAPSPTVAPGGLQNGLAQGAAQQGAQQAPATSGPAPGGRPDGAFTAQPPAPSPVGTPPTQPAQGGAATATKAAAKGGGGITFAPPEKAEKPDAQSLLPSEFQGAGGGPIVWDKNTKAATELQLPKGSKRALTTEQQQKAGEFQTRMAEVGENAAQRASAKQQQIQNELARHNDKLDAGKETAKKDFLAAMKAAITDDDKRDAARAYKADLQREQTNYETNIRTTLQKPLEPDKWVDKLDVDSLAGIKKDGGGRGGQTAPPTGQTAAPARKTAVVGMTQGGYRFKGGDPGNQANWENVGAAPKAGTVQQPKPAAPAAGTVQRGYRFKGGDPANQANWESAGGSHYSQPDGSMSFPALPSGDNPAIAAAGQAASAAGSLAKKRPQQATVPGATPGSPYSQRDAGGAPASGAAPLPAGPLPATAQSRWTGTPVSYGATADVPEGAQGYTDYDANGGRGAISINPGPASPAHPVNQSILRHESVHALLGDNNDALHDSAVKAAAKPIQKIMRANGYQQDDRYDDLTHEIPAYMAVFSNKDTEWTKGVPIEMRNKYIGTFAKALAKKDPKAAAKYLRMSAGAEMGEGPSLNPSDNK